MSEMWKPVPPNAYYLRNNNTGNYVYFSLSKRTLHEKPSPVASHLFTGAQAKDYVQAHKDAEYTLIPKMEMIFK
jgi:hypothetical protein